MYESYKRETDSLIKSLIKQALIVTAVVFIVLILLVIRDKFDWRIMLFLLLLSLWNWSYCLIVFTQRNRLLCELKENNVETKIITIKKFERHDRFTYVSDKRGITREIKYGVLRYKIKDSENEVYHFEDIMGGNRILPKVNSCNAFIGKEMEITYTKKTHYIINVKFSADKNTNFLKSEMERYFV